VTDGAGPSSGVRATISFVGGRQTA
jgi:hypothetical protein